MIVPDGPDAADVVLESLNQFSIRYHPLRSTKWQITENLLLLIDHISHETIVDAAEANRKPDKQSPALLLDQYVRYALEVATQYQRRRIWIAIELLHRMRNLLMELYAKTHDHQPLLSGKRKEMRNVTKSG
ncbi:hypothetical protein KFU94_16135 [Chloroflexi bacterium TSY]|nr:hypothetical protein [Chloroflexi bacterium TSY]